MFKTIFIALVTLASVNTYASTMSEIDLMVREQLTNFFQLEAVSLNSQQDIDISGFVTPHDEVQCDYEVAATVSYVDQSGASIAEACFVCFRADGKKGEVLSLTPQTTYCVE